jgi:hypothetical protein
MRSLTLLFAVPVLSIFSSVVPSASAQSVRVTAIPQADCPVVIEEHENGSDGSLKNADFKNLSEKTVDSIRIGWIVDSGESAKPRDVALGMSTKLIPELAPKGRVTVPATELGLAPGATGRLKFYVASGRFNNGSTFACSAKSTRRPGTRDDRVAVVHGR